MQILFGRENTTQLKAQLGAMPPLSPGVDTTP